MASAGEHEYSPFLRVADDEEQPGDDDSLPLLAAVAGSAGGARGRPWRRRVEEVVAQHVKDMGCPSRFGSSRVAGRLGCCLAAVSAIAAVATVSRGLHWDVASGKFDRTSASTGEASPLVGLLDAAVGAPAATSDLTTFPSAAATFDALDADGDGMVTVGGVAMDAATFQSMSDAQKQQAIAAHGLEYTELANDMSVLRQQAKGQGLEEGAAEMPAAVMTPALHVAGERRATVKELYTYGAPATTERGVYDAQTLGGCFAGLRVTTQATQLVAGSLRVKSDPVSSLLNFKYKHALMDFMGARKDDDQDLHILNCSYFIANQARLKDTPKWDNSWWLNGHMNYPSLVLAHAETFKSAPSSEGAPNDLPPLTKRRRLRQVGQIQAADSHKLPEQLKVERAALFAHVAFLNYARNQQIGLGALGLGWRMVARANGATDEGEASGLLGVGNDAALRTSQAGNLVQTVHSYFNGFGDRMLMLQHRKTLECALVFEGSGMDDIKDWLSNLNFAGTPFCGFGQTHKGFRAKLYRMVGGIDYRQSIRRKVGSCSSITITGHSLGGAQAELFAACVNNRLEAGEPGYMDSRLMSLPKGTPKRLQAWHSDHVNGSFLRNRGNGLCIDVEGTMRTTYRAHIIMYHCETPDSAYSHDQKWQFTSEGFIVSKLSKMCVDGNVTGSGAVRQQPCQHNVQETQQRWEHTPEGFIRNVRNGKCLDSKMQLYDCPFSDQKWQMLPMGHLRNALSGKCLDVKGSPGIEDGAALVLWPCENATGETDQLWELDSGGRLRNKFSGKCVVPEVHAGSEAVAALALGPCASAGAWRLGPGGFLRSAGGKCLNVRGTPGTADGTVVDLDTCEEKMIMTSGIWRLDRRGFIVNVGLDPEDMYKCMEIFAEPWNDDQKKAEGAELWLDFCEVNTDQKWQVTGSGLIRNVIGGQKCLSVVRKTKSANTLDTKLWIDNCVHPADPALYLESKWTKTSAGQLINKFSKKCLASVTSDQPPRLPGRRVEITPAKCKEPGINPLWDFFPNGTIVSQTDGRCLDVGAAVAGGRATALALRGCEGLEAQRWELTPEGLLRNRLNALCVGSYADVSFAGQMALLLKECPTGQAQQWEELATGQIRSKVTGECLDAPHAGQRLRGYELTAAACDPASATQQWEKITAPRVIVDEDYDGA